MIEAFTVAAILLGCLCVVLKWADRERAEEEEEAPIQFVWRMATISETRDDLTGITRGCTVVSRSPFEEDWITE